MRPKKGIKAAWNERVTVPFSVNKIREINQEGALPMTQAVNVKAMVDSGKDYGPS